MNTHRVCRGSYGLAITAAMLMIASAQAATISVINTNDSLAGSLRQAINDASSDDTIVFQIPTTDAGYNPATNTFTITLTTRNNATGAAFDITKTLTIDGGSSKITVNRSSAAGTPAFMIFNVTAGTVNILNLTLQNGYPGAIQNSSALNLRGSLLRSNVTEGTATGTIRNLASGTLNIFNCTMSDNNDDYTIRNEGSLVVRDSTLFNNHVNGAALFNNSAGVVRIRNTIAAGSTQVVNTNMPAHDAQGAFISEGYNLLGDVSQATGFGSTGDQIGATAAQVKLGPLQDNGGSTQTLRPLSGSPAIDQGSRGTDNNGQLINTDQRGQPRPVEQPSVPNAIAGDGSDIGAVEVGLPQTGPTFTVTTISEHNDGACTNDDCTLLEALNASNATAGNNRINFAPGVIGTITTKLSSGGLFVSNSVTINGPSARNLAISAAGLSRVLYVGSGNVALSGLTLTEGNVIGTDGGAIFNNGNLTLTDCTISNSGAHGNLGGAGLFNLSGATLLLVRCTVTANGTDQFGGGVYNEGMFTATNCTIANNAALRGGGIISRFNNGAATMTLRNCTITNCSASSGSSAIGGGVYAEGGAQQNHVGNTTIAGNSATGNDPDVRGNFTADTINFIGDVGDSMGLIGLAFVGDPRLDTLRNNGGLTDTCALFSDSMARDNGDDNQAPPTDQRGFLRSGTSDIGAFEFSGTLPVLKITSIARLANGHISLQGLGVANTIHTIQAASDPSAGSFSFLGTATSNASGVLSYDDAGAVGLTRRFYRLTFP